MSSGLIVGTCNTATSMWSASSYVATLSARMVMKPDWGVTDTAGLDVLFAEGGHAQI